MEEDELGRAVKTYQKQAARLSWILVIIAVLLILLGLVPFLPDLLNLL